MASVADTHYKQETVIELLVKEKESVGNIHKWLCTVYGGCAVDRSTVGCWVQRVNASGSGEAELHDQSWSGHPATATSRDMLQHANDIIHADQCITIWQLAVQLSGSNGNY
jgi:imidazole glycerol phosphate synthase subunit HisF